MIIILLEIQRPTAKAFVISREEKPERKILVSARRLDELAKKERIEYQTKRGAE